MNCPPTKRLRGLNQDVVTAFDDPFGDDEDFTQDDLDEIDIIASQAITSTAVHSGIGSEAGNKAVEPSRLSTRSTSAAQNKPPSRSTAFQSRANTFGVNRGNAGISSREPLACNRQQPQLGSGREDSYSVLEAQHAELKRRLKEVEEEILLKSGEIRVLRDSLKAAQQEKEAQRQNQILLDTQRQKEQSDKEKELNKKVQSLQTELQFKEAEINEMKTKLHNSDRNKLGSPPARSSPRTTSSVAQKHHGSGSSSSSPIGNGFITKEAFLAQASSRITTVKAKRNDCVSRSEASRPDPFQTVRPAHSRHRGGVLLGLLLQQPLSPSSLGLSHLLSMSLTDISLTTSSRLSEGFMLRSDVPAGAAGAPRAALSPVQSLAVTGLNMLSQNQRPAGLSSSSSSSSSSKDRLCPGAVLLLPLLDLHLSRLCQALDSPPSASADAGDSRSSADGSVPAGRAASAGIGRPGETCPPVFSSEETGLAALRLLYLLLAHSDEVVEAVLSNKSDKNNKGEGFAPGIGFSSQNPLLQSLLRLCDAGLGGSSSHGEEIAVNAVRTLCVLTDRAPQTHSDRLQCVLQRVCMCVSAESRLQVVSECVGVLTSMCDHQALAGQLCSQHDPCVFLKLLQMIRTRSDNKATHTESVLLDLKVVRLLSRLMIQRTETWTTSLQKSCVCNTELVQTVVIVLHRQWLDVRGSDSPADSAVWPPPPQRCPASPVPWWRGAAASLLRECLLLLHWLLLHHSSFSESCRPLLHMYDQVIPAVRDTLKKIPELSESEELALEEICRSEGDDMDVDSSS
ncbi:ATR-interacting protein-like isoform X2 [Salarias fasciatus]|uniref:ATR-interacting protein-like isoform X2 n=1 Tax=Salarias fasciatus TaxID=181472 RepID=UPI001176CDCC|nr:ATR-interacting protein-like isoform X2 [Salarias fasciatus]